MIKKTLLLVLIGTLFTTFGYSQKLKFRIDMGSSYNFMSYKPKLFMTNYQKPITTSEYTYKKLHSQYLFDNFMIGFSFEFDYKLRNHFTFGVSFFEPFPDNYRLSYNRAYPSNIPGYLGVGPATISSYSEGGDAKFRFTYSRDYGKSWLRVSPLIGLTYVAGFYVSPFDTVGYGTFEDYDYVFPNSKLKIITIDTYTANTTTMMAAIGVNFRVHTKKRELFAIKVFFEQGFRAVYKYQTIVYRNKRKFVDNVIYGYGTAFYVKLSVPIPIYNFVNHKWGK